MPKGLRLPVGVGVRGGARTIEGSGARRQNVILGVMPASNKHPWHQELTPPEDVIFDIADEFTGGLLIARIRSFFDEQERLGLTMLPRTKSAMWLDDSNSRDGEPALVINYVDLEDEKTDTVRVGGRRR